MEESITMRAAVFTDVHANLPALSAALAAIRAERCDLVYCLGDVIGIGPTPRECLELLLHTPNMRFVMGNHDAWFANGLPDPPPNWMSKGEAAHQRWTHAQLDPGWRKLVGEWPYERTEMIGPLSVTLLHYATNESGREFLPIVANPTVGQLDRLFGDREAEFVFYGHHHPFADTTGRSRYVNPGSLGCSSEPTARFTILTIAQNGSHDVDHRAVRYDQAEVFRQFEERNVPERAFIVKAFFGR
jgi:predicted phosphodiesterase